MTRPNASSPRIASIPVLLAALVLTACGGKDTSEVPASAPAKPAEASAPAPAAPAPPPAAHHWGYSGEAGPAAWAELSPDYATCGTGTAQSPIDIPAAPPAADAASVPASLDLSGDEKPADVVNNGHTVQVNYAEGDKLGVGGDIYSLAQYHFHAPSEHAVAGKHFPMEVHLVHKSATGGLAVVGVLVEEGAANSALEPIWTRMPKESGATVAAADVPGEIEDLLPTDRSCYRYDGSLTTPPCSEGVKWFVLTTPIQASAEQIAAFTAVVNNNNRPVQALNDRSVVVGSLAAK